MQINPSLQTCQLFWLAIITFSVVACKTTQLPAPVVGVVAVDSSQVEPHHSLSLLKPIDQPVNQGPYRGEKTKLHDLIHTRLELRFDWEQQHVLGKATLELRPYFYSQNSLVLDAKGFDIHSILLVEGGSKKSLTYEYDQKKIVIALDRPYQRSESYFVEIDYTAKPNELATGGSEAITSDKGLYFINPLGNDEDKPQQIWTQGETEANSCWFPTIDSPNQRSTQEMYITVEDRFTTLSNGQLVYSQGQNDGTRTDYWKMSMPHAPYLFMLAVGEFAVVKDQWEGKDVSYYVEPEFEVYAKSIFGRTPQMMTFFSELLKYPFPWSKYAQVVVRDYVSGAMENTTASVFMEDLQVDSRYLIDEDWDGIIAHELFHQWFGDLVTSESWSNLTLNEAFATYAEYLWAEHLLGKDDADYLGYEEQQNYLAEANEKKVDLIRFYYQDKEDMFDSHSYAKGSRILHMLRYHLGDDAFFSILNEYLTTHAGQPVEVHHLRLMAEKVSGQDMNWFFNQWFMDSGHPELHIKHTFEDDTLAIEITQTQNLSSAPIFRLPMEVDFWHNQNGASHSIVLDQQQQVFKFPMEVEPDLVVIDKENQLLLDLDYEQSKQELMHQYSVGYHALTRFKALEKLLSDSVDIVTIGLFLEALDDPFWAIRQLAVNVFEGYTGDQTEELVSKLNILAKSDTKSLVRADAITTLSSFPNDVVYLPLYLEAIKDSSYAVAGAGLYAYLQIDHPERKEIAQTFEDESNIQLVIPLADYYALNNIPGKYSWYQNQLKSASGELMYYLINYFGQYLVSADSADQATGASYLEDIGINHTTYYIRFSAFQALGLLDEVDGTLDMMLRVTESEKDPRLLEIYHQISQD